MKLSTNTYLQNIMITGIACTLVLLTGLSGCSSSSDVATSLTVTITGTVKDIADVNPVPGTDVEAVYTTPGNSANATTTTDSNGNFSIKVAKNVSFYLRLSNSSFATLNSEKTTTNVDIATGTLNMPTVAEAQSLISAAFSSTTPQFQNHAWLVVSAEDTNGDEINGVTISSSPTETDEVYANCDGSDSGGSATTGAPCPGGRDGVQYIAYFDSAADVNVAATSTSPPAADAAVAPVTMGEITFIDFEF